MTCPTDDANIRVQGLDSAAISQVGNALYFKIEYPRALSKNPIVLKDVDQATVELSADNTNIGFLNGETAQRHELCPGIAGSSSGTIVTLVTNPPSDETRSASSSGPRLPAKLTPVPLAHRKSTDGGPSNMMLMNELAKKSQKSGLGSLDPSRQPSSDVIAALEKYRASSANSRASASTRVSNSSAANSNQSNQSQESHSALDESPPKSDIEKRREMIAKAAMLRSQPSVISVFDLSRSSSPAPPPTLPETRSAPVVPTASLPIFDRAPSKPSASRAIDLPTSYPLTNSASQRPLQRNFTTPLPSTTRSIANLAENVPLPSGFHSDIQLDITKPFAPIIFPANSYNIVMVLDNREVKDQKHRDELRDALARNKVAIEQRPLPIGDFTWIAVKKSVGMPGEPRECVLDMILERKTIADLRTSIPDGRFHEQKVCAMLNPRT